VGKAPATTLPDFCNQPLAWQIQHSDSGQGRLPTELASSHSEQTETGASGSTLADAVSSVEGAIPGSLSVPARGRCLSAPPWASWVPPGPAVAGPAAPAEPAPSTPSAPSAALAGVGPSGLITVAVSCNYHPLLLPIAHSLFSHGRHLPIWAMSPPLSGSLLATLGTQGTQRHPPTT
jgi:hypothetical protein